MTQTMNNQQRPRALECFQCEDEVTIEELLLVDDLIGQSPFLTGLSENFGSCSGEDRRFHGNVVNCCTACYALIVQPMAQWDEVDRWLEIENIARVLRCSNGSDNTTAGRVRVNKITASAAINLEHLLAALLDADPGSTVPSEAVQEALYLATSPYHALLGRL